MPTTATVSPAAMPLRRSTFTAHPSGSPGNGSSSSSAGSGTLIAIMLIAIYRLTPKRVVGTDVVHAALLLWAAGIAHIIGGNVDFPLAANILIGSIPGVIIGSNLSVKWPQGALRYALGLILIAAGLTIMGKANTDLVPWVMVGATLAIVSLFAVQIALRREVEHDPDEQEWMRQAAVVASLGDEIERHQNMEAQLAARARARQKAAAATAED